MPKRQITPARRRQIQLWQRKGVQARKAKSRNTIPRERYHGKLIELAHRTNEKDAKSILRQGFKAPEWKPNATKTWFSTPKDSLAGGWSKRGNVVLSVRVPFRKAEIVGTGNPKSYLVPNKVLAGRKIRRIK